MLKVFSVTRENDSHSETAIVMDRSDLSIDNNALIRVCAAVWPGTLDEDYGYFALPVDTSSFFVANNILQEAEDCWVWTVKFVAETPEYMVESVYETGRAVSEELARELMMKKYVEALKELQED
jgi:hypothetical protein